MTHWQDKFEGWLKKFFVDEEYNRKMEEYERKQFFLRTIADEGYRYDQDNEWLSLIHISEPTRPY